MRAFEDNYCLFVNPVNMRTGEADSKAPSSQSGEKLQADGGAARAAAAGPGTGGGGEGVQREGSAGAASSEAPKGGCSPGTGAERGNCSCLLIHFLCMSVLAR